MNAEVPQIEASIRNAAIAQVATQRFTRVGFESQLGTNHYGHFVLTKLIFDRPVENNARIVIVGSVGEQMRQVKVWKAGRNVLKPFTATQQVRLLPN